MAEIVDSIWDKTRKISLELTLENAKAISDAFRTFHENCNKGNMQPGEYFLDTFFENVNEYTIQFTEEEKAYLLKDAKTGKGQTELVLLCILAENRSKNIDLVERRKDLVYNLLWDAIDVVY